MGLNFDPPVVGAAGPGYADDINDVLDFLDGVAWVNAKSPNIGALGDGVANDQGALDDAIAAADGGVLLIPDGTYLADGLVIPDAVTIWGAGYKGNRRTILQSRGAGPLLQLSGLRPRLTGLDLNGADLGTSGVVLHNAGRADLVNIWAHDFLEDGFLFDTAADTPTGSNNLARLWSCLATLNGRHGYAVPTRQTDNNGVEFWGCEGTSNVGSGLLYKGEGGRVEGGIWYNNGAYGIAIGDPTTGSFTQNCRIAPTWVEGNTTAGIFEDVRCSANLLVGSVLQTFRSASATPMTRMTTDSDGLVIGHPAAADAGDRIRFNSSVGHARIEADGVSTNVGIRLTPKGTGAVELGSSTLLLYWGTGSPETVVVANKGSIYLRTDGGAATCFYVKEAGNGLATGWVAK